ncbi:hypothetical protein BC937DRAFT_93810, partial [Endogone sp. FLAS-F59071]
MVQEHNAPMIKPALKVFGEAYGRVLWSLLILLECLEHELAACRGGRDANTYQEWCSLGQKQYDVNESAQRLVVLRGTKRGSPWSS